MSIVASFCWRTLKAAHRTMVQMISANRRKTVDFGDLVVESLQAQEQLASQSMDVLSDTGKPGDLYRQSHKCHNVIPKPSMQITATNALLLQQKCSY